MNATAGHFFKLTKTTTKPNSASCIYYVGCETSRLSSRYNR